MWIPTAAALYAMPAPFTERDVRAAMALDVLLRWKFWITCYSKGLGVLLSLLVVDLNLLFLLLAVLNGRHQVAQHVRVHSLDAGSFS